MYITVIVCTYNRCRLLPKTLASLANSVAPPEVDWEVLVVDNNSTDGTGEVVRDFSSRYPGRFRYVLEAKQGLSYARNTGVRESRGKLLAFTDDDVVVDPGWLWSLTSGLRSGECVGAAGRIIPELESSLPYWFPDDEPHAMGPFAAFDLGPEPVALTQAPIGANMAFLKQMFEAYGGFRADLGYSGNNVMTNDDTEFGRRLLNDGQRLRYEPAALVHHFVPTHRIQKGYLLRWWFGKGRADIAETGIPANGKLVAGVPIRLFLRFAVTAIRWTTSVRPSKRFSHKLSLWNLAGQISECRWASKSAHDKRALAVMSSD